MGKYVILILLGLFVSTTILQLQTNRFVRGSVENYADKHDQYHVRNIANSGANVALNALTVNVEETQGANNVSIYNGSYTYFIEREPEDATLGPTDVHVTCIGNFNNLSDTVVVLLTRPSFSRYAYFTNQEGNIWFTTGDTIFGPAHTNTYFQMAGQPVFWGKVTSHQKYSSSSPYREYPSGYTNPDFQGGTEWGVPALTMPTSIPQDMIDAAQNGGMYINNRYVWMEFNSNGTVDIAAKNYYSTPSSWEYTTYDLSSTNGVLYVHYHYRPYIFVEGEVNGQVTVGSKGYILVNGDLTCADNPATNPNSNDMIGLVAEKDVVVYNNQTGQDRTIQATIMTLNTSTSSTNNFWVYDYDRYRYGDLHLHGGLIQNARGAVGTFGGYYGNTGYLKDYHWDPRLQDMSPPHFPMLFVLRKIAWWD